MQPPGGGGRLVAMSEVESTNVHEVNQAVTQMLVESGERAGFVVVKEYSVTGGRIDVAWLWQPPTPIPGLEAAVPVVGFEVESSWRTRKHIKGDMVNLLDAGCALGVIVCAGDTDADESLRKFARTLVDRPGPTILIWDTDDVRRLHAAEQAEPSDPSVVLSLSPISQTDPTVHPARGEHRGKYEPLWKWLRSREDTSFTTTMGEVEEAINQALPPSCRRHVAHWHGYEGSAVARAIADAGWKASAVDLTTQTVTFTRAGGTKD